MGSSEGDFLEKLVNETFECTICNKALSSKRSLQNHIRAIHEGKDLITDDFLEEKVHQSFECSICNKSLSSKRNLQRHINAKHVMKIKEEFEEEEDGIKIKQEFEEPNEPFDEMGYEDFSSNSYDMPDICIKTETE